MPELTAVAGPARGRRWLARRDDRGAVATVVAILLAGGVLLGFLALVVDVGQIYVEREELQTGADAAVLAVAKACATAAPACSSGPAVRALAQSYADANSADGRSRVAEVCGRLANRLDPCGPDAGNLTDCLGAEPPSVPFVQVRLATELSDGTLVLPPVFAQTMAGNSGYDGTAVGACARATWQVPARSAIVGLTISTCEGQDLARGRRVDPDDPQPRDERVVFTAPGRGQCVGAPPADGWLRPGPAGWLDADASCEVHLPLSKQLNGRDSAPAPANCETRLRQAAAAHETVYLPVYDGQRGAFPDRAYRITAFAPFLVTGFVLGPTVAADPADPANAADPDVLLSWLSSGPPCALNSEERCLSGVLAGPLVPVSTLAGNSLVTLIG